MTTILPQHCDKTRISYTLKKMYLLHKNNQIFAGRPEQLRICDTQGILLLGVLFQHIAGGRMRGQQLCRTAIQADFLINTDVNLGKVLTIEVRLQHLSVLNDMLFLKFRLGTIDEPGGIQLFVLS